MQINFWIDDLFNIEVSKMKDSSRAIIKVCLIKQLHKKKAELEYAKTLAAAYNEKLDKSDPSTRSYFETYNSYRNDIRRLSHQIKVIVTALKEIKHA